MQSSNLLGVFSCCSSSDELVIVEGYNCVTGVWNLFLRASIKKKTDVGPPRCFGKSLRCGAYGTFAMA